MIYGAGSSLIATVAGTQTAVPNYRLADYLGSLGALTDESGNVLESNTFLPYGEEISGNTLDPFLFTGLEREPDASTDRALYRQYTSTDGRWLTPDLYHGSYDLMDPQSFNRYAYVNGRPTFYTDPSGLDSGGCDSVCTIAIDIGLGALFEELFGGSPGFHGSLNPRPSANDPASLGESLGIPIGLSIPSPGVAGALGLPTGDDCDFGPCSGGMGFGQNPQGVPSNITINIPPEVWFWATHGSHSSVGGPWHHGNWCGVGGSGNPTDNADASCMIHDYCYAANGLTVGDNWESLPANKAATISECNQQLCNNEWFSGGSATSATIQLYFTFYGVIGGRYGCNGKGPS